MRLFEEQLLIKCILILCIPLASMTNVYADEDPKLVRFNSENVPELPHFSSAVINKSTHTLHVSGFMATDVNGALIGKGDLAMQARKAYQNIAIVLKEAGTSPANVIRQRVFIVGIDKNTPRIIKKAMDDFYGDGPRPASTAVGVSGLFVPDAVVEIDVTASLP